MSTAEFIGSLLGSVVVILLTVTVVGVLFAPLIMVTWNYSIAGVFGAPEITFWQAFWLKMLVTLLWVGPNTGAPTVK